MTRASHRGRRVRRRIAPGLVAVSVACCAWPASGAVDDLDLVSRTSAGAPADGTSQAPSISADGRLVAFESDADNLSPEDDDAVTNIFVRDLDTGTTTLVSRRLAAPGVPTANDDSHSPAISADGRFVAYESDADNLSPEDDNTVTNIFVRDLQAQTTTLVSRQSLADGGGGADDSANGPAISADGRHVAFHSFADNLSAEDNAIRDIFVRDVQAQTTTLVSRQSAGDGGAAGDGNSVSVAISANGRVVAFTSGAGNLSAEDDAGVTNLFVRDLDAATTTLANRATGHAGAVGEASVFTPTLSADGRAVAFISSASNLSTQDDDAVDNVFVRDLAADTTTLVSRADGVAGAGADDGGTSRASISADGRHVAFDATADNLSLDDAEFTVDVFVRDLSTATTRLVSRAAGPSGAPGDDTSDDPVISADGRYIAFESGADNISSQDTDPSTDIFRRDVLGPSAPPASGGATTASAVCKSLPPVPPRSPGDPEDITLTTGQLLINQRIDQAAIRRANGVQDWIDGGIEGRDLCQGALGATELAAGIATDLAGPPIAFVAPDPRRLVVAAAKPADPSRIRLTTGQLLINQRISQAAIRRLNALKARLDGGLTGGDVDDRTLAQPAFVAGLRVLAASTPAKPPAASTTRILAAKPGDPSKVTLSTDQLLINQRISQAAVRRANELLARIEDGLLASDVRDGGLTALDLAPGVAP